MGTFTFYGSTFSSGSFAVGWPSLGRGSQAMLSNIRLNGANKNRRSSVDELSQRIRSSAAARVGLLSPSRVMTLAPFGLDNFLQQIVIGGARSLDE